MRKDERDLLEVLKFELEFLEKGGYGRSPRTPYKALFVFQDSPTCMNYDNLYRPRPCSECVLMQLVPPERRGENVPCWHIPLNEEGQTVDSFYRWGTQEELEQALRTWLWTTTLWLEDERRASEISTRKRNETALCSCDARKC